MYNQEGCNYLKNFVEKKNSRKKIKSGRKKTGTKKGGYTQLKKKMQENLRYIAEREEGKNGFDKTQCDG